MVLYSYPMLMSLYQYPDNMLFIFYCFRTHYLILLCHAFIKRRHMEGKIWGWNGTT